MGLWTFLQTRDVDARSVERWRVGRWKPIGSSRCHGEILSVPIEGVTLKVRD